MITINRKEAMDNMMSGIFGHKGVAYDGKNIIINYTKNPTNPYTAKAIDNLRNIIIATFKNNNIEFKNYKKEEPVYINKEMVLDNTVDYFRELGINIPEVVNSTEKTLLGIQMCNAILVHILPAIFSNINAEKERKDIDNISLEFNKAVDAIKSEFNSGDFFEQLYVDIKSSDVEKLYDSDYSMDECNYGLCVYSYLQSVFYVFKPVPSIYYYAHKDKLVLYEDLSNLNSLIDDCFNAPKQSENSFEKLTERFINKAALENKNFVSPYYYNINQNNCIDKTMNCSRGYQLSFNENIPNHVFIPRYFYFMTKLDKTITKENYPECKSSIDLDYTITEKAIKQIRIEYTEKIAQYYVGTLTNIEDVCRKFLAIDIETILSQKISDFTEFKKALSSLCHENEIKAVWDFCVKYTLTAQQTSRYIYCGIEDAIWVYLHYITSLTKPVGEKKSFPFLSIERNITKNAFLKHTITLANLLTEFNIDNLIKLRDKYKSFTWATNAGFNLDYYIEGHEQRVDKGEQNIYQFMKTSITDYCAALRNAVNRD